LAGFALTGVADRGQQLATGEIADEEGPRRQPVRKLRLVLELGQIGADLVLRKVVYHEKASISWDFEIGPSFFDIVEIMAAARHEYGACNWCLSD
jgi:hypothetical protein